MRRIRYHLSFANVTSVLALLVAIGGTTAYAVDGPNPGQNTIGSEDIIGNEVKSDDIGNGRIFNLDIADETITGAKIKDSWLTDDDLAFNSVGGEELKQVEDLSLSNLGFSDVLGGGPSRNNIDVDDGAELQFIAECDEATSGNIKASIVVKSIGTVKTLAVDSNAPNGVKVPNVAHGSEATLVSTGPTSSTSYSAGDYSIISSELPVATTGNVSVATDFPGTPECQFNLTRLR